MNRLGRLFIREVNLAILGVLASAMVASGAHYVSLVRETQRVREELCAVKLELVSVRNPYLRTITETSDKCATLSTVTGQPLPSRRASLRLEEDVQVR